MKKKKGFTLVELVLVLALVAILASFVTTAVFLGLESTRRKQAQTLLRLNLDSIKNAYLKTRGGFNENSFKVGGVFNDAKIIEVLDISGADIITSIVLTPKTNLDLNVKPDPSVAYNPSQYRSTLHIKIVSNVKDILGRYIETEDTIESNNATILASPVVIRSVKDENTKQFVFKMYNVA